MMITKPIAFAALLVLYNMNCCCSTFYGPPKVPCFFIFGDSLSDVGNNNNLNTKAKVNYPPYGIDFRGGQATGRFSNGRNFVDKLALLLGFKDYIPPFCTAKEEEILKGVNYASGAAGIRPETGRHLGENICMDQQLLNHQMTIVKWRNLGQTQRTLKECLYSVNIGSNDYMNNYFLPQHYESSKLYNLDQYANDLIRRYTVHLQELYAAGARKFVIGGLSLIGCIPAELAMHNTTKCVPEINHAVEIFNNKLLAVVDQFNAYLPGANLTFINFSTMQGLTRNILGFETDAACCKLRDDYQCEPNSTPCNVRTSYEFLDGFHPTEAVNDLAAMLSFSTPLPTIVKPYTILQILNN